jgi:hypothetical protein
LKPIFENSWITTLEIKIETRRKLHDKKFNSVGLVGGIKMNKLKREAKKAIKQLLREHQRSRERAHGKYGFYQYLDKVYDQFAEWRETPGMATKMRRQFAKLAKLPNATQNTHSFHVVISATSNEDNRTQSRWAQAMRYAWKYRKRRNMLSLADFFKKNGGPAGCATKYSRGVKPNLK